MKLGENPGAAPCGGHCHRKENSAHGKDHKYKDICPKASVPDVFAADEVESQFSVFVICAFEIHGFVKVSQQLDPSVGLVVKYQFCL